ncbi:MAG TPA: hypothetical protein VNM66_00665, partial [Thermodesulfobacteriota bacterium]|nr:hypothetical protein [Thermodesulfobacteriota bacterium]
PAAGSEEATAPHACVAAVSRAGAGRPAAQVADDPKPPAQAPSGAVAGSRVPGLADLIHDDAALFTRRLPDGELVAFAFVPRELTSRGWLLGRLSYAGRRVQGAVETARVRPALGRSEAGGLCGSLRLDFEPVTLDPPGLRVALDPVEADVRRATGTVAGLAARLCRGGDHLADFLRELEAALRSLARRGFDTADGRPVE